jgi:hypothetical protein
MKYHVETRSLLGNSVDHNNVHECSKLRPKCRALYRGYRVLLQTFGMLVPAKDFRVAHGNGMDIACDVCHLDLPKYSRMRASKRVTRGRATVGFIRRFR